MESYIQNWAVAEGGTVTNPNPGPTSTTTPSPTPSGTSGILVYQRTVQALVLANCSGCHNGSQTPNFAVTNVSSSYNISKALVNFTDIMNSKLYIRIRNGHCGQVVCQTDGTAMQSAIQQWAVAEGF